MFTYFWDEIGGYLWNEDSFENVFKLMAKRELSDMVPSFIGSKTTKAIFEGMSYLYKFTFLEHLLSLKWDINEELHSFVKAALSKKP